MRQVVLFFIALIFCGISELNIGQETKPAQTDVEKAIEKALEWLARNQNSDGSWGHNVKIASTSLACLAFMAGGHLPGRGKYSQNIQKGLSYILKHVTSSGFIGHPADGSRMHGHGYALLFLSELYGLQVWESDEEALKMEHLKEKIISAIKLTENAQSDISLPDGKKAGGWIYYPQGGGDEGSVTITQVQALRSARNAGLSVKSSTIQKAENYILGCYNPNGSVKYSYHGGGGGSFALTAAGTAVACYLGLYENKNVKKGVEFIKRYTPGAPNNQFYSQWFFYSNFYAAQVMFFQGGEEWQNWWNAISQYLIRNQDPDGSWSKGSEAASYGKALSTAFAALILQIPNRYLSIFQSPKE